MPEEMYAIHFSVFIISGLVIKYYNAYTKVNNLTHGPQDIRLHDRPDASVGISASRRNDCNVNSL